MHPLTEHHHSVETTRDPIRAAHAQAILIAAANNGHHEEANPATPPSRSRFSFNTKLSHELETRTQYLKTLRERVILLETTLKEKGHRIPIERKVCFFSPPESLADNMDYEGAWERLRKVAHLIEQLNIRITLLENWLIRQKAKRSEARLKTPDQLAHEYETLKMARRTHLLLIRCLQAQTKFHTASELEKTALSSAKASMSAFRVVEPRSPSTQELLIKLEKTKLAITNLNSRKQFLLDILSAHNVAIPPCVDLLRSELAMESMQIALFHEKAREEHVLDTLIVRNKHLKSAFDWERTIRQEQASPTFQAIMLQKIALLEEEQFKNKETIWTLQHQSKTTDPLSQEWQDHLKEIDSDYQTNRYLALVSEMLSGTMSSYGETPTHRSLDMSSEISEGGTPAFIKKMQEQMSLLDDGMSDSDPESYHHTLSLLSLGLHNHEKAAAADDPDPFESVESDRTEDFPSALPEGNLLVRNDIEVAHTRTTPPQLPSAVENPDVDENQFEDAEIRRHDLDESALSMAEGVSFVPRESYINGEPQLARLPGDLLISDAVVFTGCRENPPGQGEATLSRLPSAVDDPEQTPDEDLATRWHSQVSSVVATYGSDDGKTSSSPLENLHSFHPSWLIRIFSWCGAR
jgi:hypothetical protein